MKKRHALDCFSYIRLINFIRAAKPNVAEVLQMADGKAWADDAYLKPVIENDPLLMYDIEEDEEECGAGTLQNLRNELGDMKVQAELLEQALNDVEKMRKLTQKFMSGGEDEVSLGRDVASRIKADEDGGYAGSYAHFSIHHEMLSDNVRTEAYRDALENNKDQIKGKTVLDLGCGTGILSMFSARAGAQKVVGVDMSDILNYTTDIVRENGLQDKIQLIKGRLEDVKDLDGSKFDVLVSEWMGYFLLYEGMLDSVISARDKYLAPGGLILPNDCYMHLFAISDEERYKKTIDFWKDVYGFT